MRVLLAPPATDLLDPEAVEAFLDTTHRAYAKALAGHLGSTVVAMFTDEPSLLGRYPRPDAVPFTTAFTDEAAAGLGLSREELLTRLPALWDDADGEFARAWAALIHRRLHRVYYGAQARWCEAEGIALTGHPETGDDLGSAATFHWPGQDTVWRWVLPGTPTALEGPESTAPKGAASAAHLRGHGMAVAEVLGAYGWQLTLDETKWLLDWYLSRGVPTLVMHAFFSSVRGNRAYESEPDLGHFNTWWPHFPRLVAYTARLAGLITTSTHTAAVAVLADPDHLPYERARVLYENQIDFFYIDPAHLAGAEVDHGHLVLGDQRYLAVVDDRLPRTATSTEAARVLRRFADGGGLVVPPGTPLDPAALRAHLERAGGDWVRTSEPAPGLRVMTLRRAEETVYVLFNEGEEAVRTGLALARPPSAPRWRDPLNGGTWPATSHGAEIDVVLERRQTLVLEQGDPAEEAAHLPVVAEHRLVLDRWTSEHVTHLGSGPAPDSVPPGDWARHPDTSRLAGTYRYRTRFELPPDTREVTLDLGRVGQAAKVLLNGTEIADLMWSPYRCRLPAGYLAPGTNHLDVLVSNSAANHYEAAGTPSGLIGPVTLSY